MPVSSVCDIEVNFVSSKKSKDYKYMCCISIKRLAKFPYKCLLVQFVTSR